MSAGPADEFIASLSAWKTRYGSPDTGELERLLAAAASTCPPDASALIRLHETLLFLRAYPRNREVARLADRALFAMSRHVSALRAAGADLSPLEDSEVSGISGAGLTAVFSYEVARRLAARHKTIDIEWEACDDLDRLGPVVRRFLPLVEEDWPVEAHPPFRQWLEAARPRGARDLPWLTAQIARLDLDDRARADLYESAQLPLHWDVGDGPHTRSRLRLKGPIFCHTDPLLRRRDVSLYDSLTAPPLPIARLSAREAARILDIILDTSAMRYRELYGFTHPDADHVFRADPGRGLQIYFFGVPPAWRLPLRAYHAGMFFKNGVPAGYVEVLSLFDRAEVGFNLYYTFREGESAWIYACLLRLFHQVLGVNTFSVDPYQLGHLNDEAVESGAFWFYRKLGFHPADRGLARLVHREESRIARDPGYRSSRRTLQKLAAGYMLYDGPGAVPGMWDRFRVRNVGLAATRLPARSVDRPLADVISLIPGHAKWPPAEKSALAAILRAKYGPDEAKYLRLTQKHTRLRAAFLKLGSAAASAPRP